MKFLFLILFISCFSCKQKQQQKPAKELIRFVNDQNDGFDAFNISIFDDSTYERDASLFEEDVQRGNYSTNDTAIYFKSGKLNGDRIVFAKDSSGRINKPVLYQYNISSTPMRIIFDSLFLIKRVAPK